MDDIDAVGQLMVGELMKLDAAALRVACGRFRRLLDSACPETKPVVVPAPVEPMGDKEARSFWQLDAFFDRSISIQDVPRHRLEWWAEECRKNYKGLSGYLLSPYRMRQDGVE